MLKLKLKRMSQSVRELAHSLLRASVRTDVDRRHLIRLVFEAYLDRLPDQAAETAYLEALRDGLSLSDFISIVTTSTESRDKRERATQLQSKPQPCIILGTNTLLTKEIWSARQQQLRTIEKPLIGRISNTPFAHTGEYVVSAIASLYRGKNFIKRFLDNITSQTIFDRSELIIIDADSPEGEFEIIQQYMNAFPNIVYRRVNFRIGIYDAWNEGVRLARGRYLTNTNVDDLRRIDSFQCQARDLDTNSWADVVYQDVFYSMDPGATFEEVEAVGYKSNVMDVTPRSLLQYNWPHNAPMWRAQLHRDVGLFDPTFRSARDYEFWLRCLERRKRFYKSSDPSVVYYFNPEGISTSAQSKGVEETGRVQRVFSKRYQQLGLEL